MGDTWIIDITHFLMPDGTLASGPPGRLARYFVTIIAAASTQLPGVWVETDIRCRRRPGRRPCSGRIRAIRLDAQNVVQWQCTNCDDNGRISNWRERRQPRDK